MTKVSEADAINTAALRYYRQKAGYPTQSALAHAIRCSTDQVNRWETGRTKKPKGHLIKALTQALKVEWDNLTRPPPTDDSSSEHTIQLNRKVRLSTRTALELVSARYGVSWRNILELAPLTFAILAEQSLAAREQALNDAQVEIEEATDSANNTLSYIPGAFVEYHTDESRLDEEEESIKRREVFQLYYDGNEEMSPFVDHLKKLVQALEKLDVDIQPRVLETPEYRFANEHIEELTGLTGDNEKDRDIVGVIQDDYLDLQEVLAKKKNLGTAEYRDWLESRYADAVAQRQERAKELVEFLDNLLLSDNQDGLKTEKREGKS